MFTYIEFHGFTSRINSKGYHSLVPGLISIFFRGGMGPFKNGNLYEQIKSLQEANGWMEREGMTWMNTEGFVYSLPTLS